MNFTDESSGLNGIWSRENNLLEGVNGQKTLPSTEN